MEPSTPSFPADENEEVALRSLSPTFTSASDSEMTTAMLPSSPPNISLKRTFRSELMEHLPHWQSHSPARKKLKSSPGTSPAPTHEARKWTFFFREVNLPAAELPLDDTIHDDVVEVEEEPISQPEEESRILVREDKDSKRSDVCCVMLDSHGRYRVLQCQSVIANFGSDGDVACSRYHRHLDRICGHRNTCCGEVAKNSDKRGESGHQQQERSMQILIEPNTTDQININITPLPVSTYRSLAKGFVDCGQKSVWKKWLITIHQSKPPYFILFVNFVQGMLFITSKAAEELVWDSHLFPQQPWRIVTYALLHSGDLHLMLNLLVQSVVAVLLEREQGPWRVALVYIAGAISGSLGTALLQPTLRVLGASAGVYALLTSHLAHIVLNRKTVRKRQWRLAAVLLLAFADVAYTVHHELHRGSDPRIGVGAHIAGALSGLLVGMAVFKSETDHLWVQVCRIVFSFIYLTTSLGIVLKLLTYPP